MALLKRKQAYALKLLIEGYNVFLSGEAGTGKSFVIEQFIKELERQGKKYVVCAPTGLAALQVGGTTLHKTFGLSIELLDFNASMKNVEEAEVIIIDEISMCRKDNFQKIARAIKAFENPIQEFSIERESKICRKKQIVVVGDFYQLPPIVSKKDLLAIEDLKEDEINRPKYKDVIELEEKKYAFECKEWEAFDFKNVVLDEVVRQSDRDYIDNLNLIRTGDIKGLDFINKHSRKTQNKKAIYLSCLNTRVDKINENNLKKIKDEGYTYYAKIKGTVGKEEKVTAEELELKIGARVMSLVNVKESVANGMVGTVIDLDEESVKVEFDNGIVHEFEPHKWEVKGFVKVKVKDKETGKETQKVECKEVGSFTQIPLKLAWAVSVHKSQGQTYEAVNFDPTGCFAEGQLYVALSRAKELKKLHVKGELTDEFLKSSEVVKEFYEKILEQQEEEILQLAESEVAITETIEEIDTKEEKLDIVDEINETRDDEAPDTDTDTDTDYITMNIPKAFEKKVLSILKDGSANEINRLNRYADNLERDLTKANASNIRKDMKIHKLEKQIEELTQELEKLKASSGRRPKISKDVELRIVELRKLGLSMNKIASRVGVGDGTVMRVLSDHNIN